LKKWRIEKNCWRVWCGKENKKKKEGGGGGVGGGGDKRAVVIYQIWVFDFFLRTMIRNLKNRHDTQWVGFGAVSNTHPALGISFWGRGVGVVNRWLKNQWTSSTW